ncbi:winged helix DNA-binding protein [Kribbella amoyensis]|uniref:Winged helix DNA-binding protein n=1 Tax=Kribbella amoyensis TaxID=996641 RepID=A0A561BZM1_9ACTN|nr:crosslink repair DNA glycosylase YcaQ family protein [Kribbella amoyensis]TWD84344.1 winged helix DNA-binding protein [Kribbella amoyensis]
MAQRLAVTHGQAVRYRLAVNHLARRLPPGTYAEAAYAGLQDTAPRDALIGLHARVADCEPSAWEHADPNLRGACASGRIALRWTTSALYVREVPRPDIDFLEAHKELCRRHVHAFGPTTPEVFAWWSGLARDDADEVWRLLADELLLVELEGRPAWILATDEPALRDSPVAAGPRYLVASDLRLVGQDRYRLFVGPGQKRRHHLYDTFHPHGLLLDGRLAGTWGRRGGQVDLRVDGSLSDEDRAAVEAEALSVPIPGATMSIAITEYAVVR